MRNLRNIAHIVKIARTFARHDALFPVELLETPSLSFIARIARRRKKNLSQGQRLANAFVALGPTFVKLGQVLSTRSDLVGEEIATQLAVLRDSLPAFPTQLAREIVETELKLKIEDIFDDFSEPVAAASIAQVHFAKLKNGEEVAVKILRPNIEKKIARDLDLFLWIAQIIERRNPGYAKRLQPVQIVGTLAETIKAELDLRIEAASASQLRENFVGWKGFYVPNVHWQYISQRVMVMEKVGGIKIDERDELIKAGLDPHEIMANSSKALFKQVFDDGFFHADLHPGNVFVNARGEIVPIDFGIMGRLDPDSRIYMARILGGFMKRDYMEVAQAHFDAGYIPPHKSVAAFALACRSVGEPVMGLPLNEISVARLLGQMFKVAEDFEMIAQPHLLLLQKTMMMAEGVGRSLNPNVNMWKLAEPLVIDWAKRNMGIRARISALLEELNLPEPLREIIKLVCNKLPQF